MQMMCCHGEGKSWHGIAWLGITSVCDCSKRIMGVAVVKSKKVVKMLDHREKGHSEGTILPPLSGCRE